jgi:hypothetical protein
VIEAFMAAHNLLDVTVVADAGHGDQLQDQGVTIE